MACNGNCNCNCKESVDVSVGDWEPHDPFYTPDYSQYEPLIKWSDLINSPYVGDSPSIQYKYAEDKILADLKAHLDKTYSEHYMTEDQSIECFDAWIALGDSTPTFRNTALKYLWRYGKKNGNNKKDLLKALHYVIMCLYVDHYKDNK